MAEGTSHTVQHDFVYIDLDDPRPWWASVVGLVAIALIVVVLAAPWMIDWDSDSTNPAAAGTLPSTSTVCQPNSAGLPTFLDPTVASWNRFCEWFVEPEAENP